PRSRRCSDASAVIPRLPLRAAADAAERYPARALSQTLLKLFAVVIGGRLLDLRLDLIDAGKDVVLFAGAIDDRRVLLLDAYPLGAAEHVEGHVLELGAQVVRDQLTTGQGRDVLEHGLAAIAEPRRLHRRHLEAAAQLVDDERRKRLAFDVLSHDQQGPGALHDGFENWQQRLEVGELL